MEQRLIPLDGARRVEYQDERGIQKYRKQRDGAIHVKDAAAARGLIKEGLAFPASATGPVAHIPGFACGDCGRRNYFKRCGSCGSDNGIKEQ